jgi:pimeloyl-ACP methyl ester carboxylesterase
MEMARAPAARLGTAQGSQGGVATRTLAGLAADDYGHSDDRAPLVLLHGLTFDRSLWRPSLAELSRIDPGRRVLALDLPGHGASPGWPSYDVQSLADGIHRAVEEAGFQSPVVVGHSIAAIVATSYAAKHPTRGIINVDQPLQVAPFAVLVQSLADKLRGPAFPAVTLEAVRSAGVPYLIVAGAELEPEYEKWLSKTLPKAAVTVWPGGGHFPHIACPGRFAECLAATAHPSGQTQGNEQPA